MFGMVNFAGSRSMERELIAKVEKTAGETRDKLEDTGLTVVDGVLCVEVEEEDTE